MQQKTFDSRKSEKKTQQTLKISTETSERSKHQGFESTSKRTTERLQKLHAELLLNAHG